MDNPRDVKILMLFLGFLAICSGKQMRAPDAGYNYNRGQSTSSPNGILKAVLVHESTGHGVHSGSVSSSGGSSGLDFKVTKQRPSSGYSYSSNQPMNGNIRPVDVTTIRVFHESSGNTGNIVRNYSPPAPRGFSHTNSSPNPSHSLRYIHENALSRSRPVQQNIDRSQGHNTGYQYMASQQATSAGNFYGAAQGNGYQYPGPIQGNQRNSGNIGTNALQSAILSISQSQNVDLQSVATGGLSSSGYQYSNPVHQNRGSDAIGNGFGSTGGEDVRNTFTSPAQNINPQAASSGYQYPGPYQALTTGPGNENQRNAFTSSSQAQNVNQGNPETASQGHQYSRQNSLPPSNGYMYMNPIRVENVDPRSTAGGSQARPDSASNGYQYQAPIQSNDNQQNTGNPSPLQAAISSLSQAQTSSNGYQYPNPNVNRNLGNENQASQGQNLGSPQGGQNGYQYSSQIPNDNKNLQGVSLQTNTEGYRYEGPRSADSQGGAEQIAISHYSSSKQLNSAFQGYRYENPALTQTSPTEGNQYSDQSVKGTQPRPNEYQYPNTNSETRQSQATGTTQSANAGYHYDGPIQALEVSYNSQQGLDNGYRYDKPEKPAVTKSTFKGQPYLPLPPAGNNGGYQQNSPQAEGYRYDKPELSDRPQTTFKGQSYLPLPERSSRPRLSSPPVSGGW